MCIKDGVSQAQHSPCSASVSSSVNWGRYSSQAGSIAVSTEWVHMWKALLQATRAKSCLLLLSRELTPAAKEVH